MSTQSTLETVTLPSSGNLSTHQFKFGVVNGSGQVALAGAGTRVDGVIANKPAAQTDPVEFQVGGIVNVIAAGAINPGAEVASDASGLAVAAAGGNYVAGVHVGTAAAAANDVIRVLYKSYKI
jgi:hypothetical protein